MVRGQPAPVLLAPSLIRAEPLLKAHKENGLELQALETVWQQSNASL